MRRPVIVSAAVCLLTAASHVAAQPLADFTLGPGATAKVGVLAQPAVDLSSVPADRHPSLYFERLRLLVGARLPGRFSVFLDTDSPKLGVVAGHLQPRQFFLLDLVVTATVRREFQIDAGQILVPLGYNSLQSAASLLPVGYGGVSFLASAPTTSRYGRDQGVQARGYVGRHLEYRAGVFRGVREVDPGAPPRVAGRLTWHVAGQQTGLFYTGTTHGAARTVAFGLGFDAQGEYRAAAIDAFLEQPLPNGDAFTLQGDLFHYDGGATLRTLARQRAWLVEAGYHRRDTRCTFFTQLAMRHPVDAYASGMQAGVAWWPKGHRFNVKAALGRSRAVDGRSSTTFVVQSQLFAF